MLRIYVQNEEFEVKSGGEPVLSDVSGVSNTCSLPTACRSLAVQCLPYAIIKVYHFLGNGSGLGHTTCHDYLDVKVPQ